VPCSWSNLAAGLEPESGDARNVHRVSHHGLQSMTCSGMTSQSFHRARGQNSFFPGEHTTRSLMS